MKTMISFVAGLVGLFALAPTGVAEAQGYNWTGFYAGGNLGYASGSSDSVSILQTAPNANVQDVNNLWSPTLHPNGVSGGLQGGFNWQWNSLVFGAELEMNSFGTKDQVSLTSNFPGGCLCPHTLQSRVWTDWLLTFRPRIGWAADNWLFYVTGGLAVTDLHARWQYSDVLNEAQNSTASATKAGSAVGGGIEIGLTRNLTVKGEFLFLSFGSISTSGNFTPAALNIPVFHSANLNTAVGRLGLNYRF